jgi:P4 family phage/plasmid primase-like protien
MSAARNLVDLGFYVLPLHYVTTDGVCSCPRGRLCPATAKHPANVNGVTGATRDQGTLKDWTTRYPSNNWGVAGGQPLPDGRFLIIVDVDPRNDGSESLAMLVRTFGELPPTRTALTGRGDGGQHFYFGARSPLAGKELDQLPGIDIKGAGGYVVAPPSVHATGRLYVWDCGQPDDIADLPGWFESLLGKKKDRPPTTGASALDTVFGTAFSAMGWLGHHLGDGKYAVRCPFAHEHTAGGDGGDSSTVILPPIETSGLGLVACKHAHCGERRWNDYAGMFPVDVWKAAMESHKRAAPKASDPRTPASGRGVPDSAEAPAKSEAKSSTRSFKRGDHVELGAALNKSLRASGPVVFAEGDTYRYDAAAGVWKKVDVADQSRTVQRFAGIPSGKMRTPLELRASDVSGALKLAHDQIAQADFFMNSPPGLVFANGYVRVSADGISREANSPDHRARHAFSFDFDDGAPPGKFLRFLDALFRDDADRDEKSACLQEFAGASLLGIATQFQRCVVNIGGGENGKSKLADILNGVMPDGSVEAIPPQEWSNEYRRAMLAGKRLNVVAELPESDIIASEAFKAIIAGDPILGRQIYQPPFTFRPTAGHLFAANKLPGTNDQTDGFWRRLVVLRFNRSFKDDPNRNPRIAEEILAEERPAIAAWMLAGALRLVRAGDYTLPASHHEELRRWRLQADQVSQFLAERTEPDEGEDARGTAAATLYRTYQTWTYVNGHRAISSTKFGMRMKDLGKEAVHTRGGNVYPVAVKAREGS